VPLDIGPGVTRAFNVVPTLTYTGPTGTNCADVRARALQLIARVTPVGFVTLGGGGGGKDGLGVKYAQYASTYRVCQNNTRTVAAPTTVAECAAGEIRLID
jgi:hypothetical protein